MDNLWPWHRTRNTDWRQIGTICSPELNCLLWALMSPCIHMFGAESPLYHQDVEKTDRQDNNASTRVHSMAAMAFLAKHHKDCLGLIIYLFIFGELIDTYQNQKIPHIERIKMALHARFFIDMWQSFLKATGYSETHYFISRKFADILGFLMDGLISLVVIHWDHMGGEIYPLLPWLHSSETCKHIFGECQKLIKDFTFLNFSIWYRGFIFWYEWQWN